MDEVKFANKFESWKERYSWESCKAGRKEFGLFITEFLTTESRVINLNGTYGAGKTEFIRRLYVELATQRHPVVYIDVWESDFSTNPLAVICSELIQQIGSILEERAPKGKGTNKADAAKFFNKLKGLLGRCLKYAEAGAIFSGDSTTIASTKAASLAVSATPDTTTQSDFEKLVETVQKNQTEAVQAVKDIKTNITFLSELIEIIYELKTPIVILVDELDRCRPNYAIEILESIKHFFETKGCTFLVATNTEVLEHSVRSVYGQTFDAKLYLRRFFERKVTLPQVSIYEYLSASQLDFDKYLDKNVKLYPYYENQLFNLGLFAALFEKNNIELRDIEQIVSRFFASLDYVVSRSISKTTVLNTVVLIVGLIEQHLEIEECAKRTNGNDIPAQLLKPENQAGLINCMFKCVTKVMTHNEYSSGTKITHHTQKLLLNIQTTDYMRLKLPFENNRTDLFFRKLLAEVNDNNVHYYLWEDHQKLIELSGHIE